MGPWIALWKSIPPLVALLCLGPYLLLAAPGSGLGLAAAVQGPLEAAQDSSSELDRARDLLKEGRYSETEALCRRLLREAEAAHGAMSLEAAEVLDVLVESLWRGGKAADPECRTLAERAVKIKEKALGPDDLGVATSLNGLAGVLSETGDGDGARPLYERTLAIREKALGPDHPDVAKSLNNLGILFSDMGDYARARQVFDRALAIMEKALGPDHPDVARTLNNLVYLLQATGDYAAAKPLCQRALDIRQKALGPDHPAVATSLNNLAHLFCDTGDYAGARPLYERALDIREKALGPDHPVVAHSLNNLGMLLNDMGDYAGARPLHERALAIGERALGPEHPDVAKTLNNLGIVCSNMGDYRKARELFDRALGILETTLGPDHPEVAQTLNNLVYLLESTGDYAAARPMCQRALDIREKALGPDHPAVAHSLDNLALLLGSTGDYAAAKPPCERALAIQKKTLGPDHPDVAETLRDLSGLLIELGEPAEAFSSAQRAEEISRAHLALTSRTLPERQALRYSAVRVSGLDLVLSLAAENRREVPACARQAWDALVRSRALVLDEMSLRHRAVVETGDAEVARLMGEVESASTRLANLTIRGAGDEDPERYRKLLDATREEKEQAERVLAKKSVEFREEQARLQIGFAEVERALPVGAALVAYVRYNDAALSAMSAKKREPVPCYLVFVLTGQDRAPEVVRLGAASEVDTLVARWREVVSHGGGGKGRSEKAAEITCRGMGEGLRERIWDPVVPHLGNVERVFVVPDGSLNLVNLAALPAGASGYLVEEGPLCHYLSTERDLVPLAGEKPRGEGLLAVGGLDYDARIFAALASGQEEQSDRERPGSASAGGGQAPVGGAPLQLAGGEPYRGPRSECGDFQSLVFRPLPASGREAKEVVSLWARDHKSRDRGLGERLLRRHASESAAGVVHLDGAAASEAAFKAQAPGKRVLHLATHGFFVGGRCASALESSDREPGQSAWDRDMLPPMAGDNPLLLSGLALAGANHRAAAGPNEEDGVLTAEEIAALDLTGVEWAVLSGCDTGVGEVKAGEGVFGLRRAFEVAGAGTLIMSLWPVEDESAREWMRALYESRLLQGLGTAEAVREASRSLLQERRKHHQSTHPAHWAAFVAAGDWK